MISMEFFDAFLEHHFLFFLEERCTYADTLLIGTHSVERVNCDAIEHQFASQLQIIHSRILHSEVETVSQRCSHIIVIYQIEAVGEQHILQIFGTATVLLYIIEEIIATFASCFHQCSHGVLHAMRRTA